MAGETGEFELDIDKIKDYAANASRVGGAISSLFKHDGFQIFLALYHRKKKDIMAKDDYETLEAFKGDRKAIEIIDELFEEMKGFIEEADDAAKALVGISGEEPAPRGIMLIEAMEESGRES